MHLYLQDVNSVKTWLKTQALQRGMMSLQNPLWNTFIVDEKNKLSWQITNNMIQYLNLKKKSPELR